MRYTNIDGVSEARGQMASYARPSCDTCWWIWVRTGLEAWMNECCLNIQVKTFMNAMNECFSSQAVTHTRKVSNTSQIPTFKDMKPRENRVLCSRTNGALFPPSLVEELWAYLIVLGPFQRHVSREMATNEWNEWICERREWMLRVSSHSNFQPCLTPDTRAMCPCRNNYRKEKFFFLTTREQKNIFLYTVFINKCISRADYDSFRIHGERVVYEYYKTSCAQSLYTLEIWARVFVTVNQGAGWTSWSSFCSPNRLSALKAP